MTKGTNVKLRMSASMDAYTECFSFRQPTVCRMQLISLHIKECVTALKVHWPTWFICGSNEAFTHHALSFWPKLKQTAVCSPASSYVQSVGVICTYKSNKRHAPHTHTHTHITVSLKNWYFHNDQLMNAFWLTANAIFTDQIFRKMPKKRIKI